MVRDRSLEEFLSEGAEASSEPTTDADDTLEEGVDDGDERESPENRAGDDVDAAVSTYRWDPDGIECVGCERIVERAWTRERDFVCSDCKAW
ncbi:DUF7573 domain-containing protein [Halobellus sp. GM3]|uniref:DUF7573 domain-containing protein n=1 Tax=Halobellus sp. GM3 TaxID=3458410 RepID=UPI00403DF252